MENKLFHQAEKIALADLAATQAFGAAIASQMEPGQVVLLEGPLGAGKTSFAQGFLQGLGCTEKVTSPTFAICNRYDALACEEHHYDLYRIEKPQDLRPIGFEESLESGAILLIEWAGRSLPLLYGNLLLLRFEHRESGREVQVNWVSVQDLGEEDFLTP